MDANVDAELPRGLGAFRIVRRLPASSREVFLAEDVDGKRVVLKVFGAPERNKGLFDPKLAEEASAYARLSHPNIVRVLDMFSADGRFVIVLEYLEGTSLAVLRAELDRSGRAVPDACWLYAMSCVFGALAEAHAAKDSEGKPAPVLHRGVNPSNVLVGWDGSVKLGNFNVAHSARVLRDSNPGITWGSYGYFAPEQVRLMGPRSCTDVYSATLMLWELLAGRKAIERGSLPDAELLKAMASPSLPPLEQIRHDLPAPVRYAVRAGLEPDASRRVVSASRIRDVLRAAVDVDAARAQLVELLAEVRPAAERVGQSDAPPLPSAPPEPVHAPPAAPIKPQVVEIISVAPDPASDPPPPPEVPPLSPAPVEIDLELPPLAPPPPAPALEARLFPDAPVTPPGIVLDIPNAPAPAPVPTPAPMPVLTRLPPTSNRRRKFVWATVAVWVAAFCVTGAGLAKHPRSHAAAVQAATAAPETVHAAATASAPAAPAVAVTVAAPPPRVHPAPPPPAESETASAAPSATASAAPSATASAAPSATASAAPAIASDRGRIELPKRAAGHRIYVDHRVVGDGDKPVDVKCGPHVLRIGSHGKWQHVDVPCGDVLTLD